MNIKRKIAVVTLIFALVIVSVLALTSCGESGAEKQVEADLEVMQTTELAPDLYREIQSLLSEESKTDFDTFLKKVDEFEYEITGSRQLADETIVNVRITTYNFGREYLASWSEYLSKYGDNEEFNESAFYSILMKNLSRLEFRVYEHEVPLHCTRSEDGTWQTDAETNIELRNTLLGGMITEIRALAE